MAVSNTLKNEVRLQGVGLHTGVECEVVIKPAPVGSGITFVTSAGEIPAVAENAISTHRGTVLSSGKAQVSTVEHLLSALAGMGVDDAQVELNGPEVPSCDGSALPFVQLIEEAGIQVREAEQEHITITQPIWVSNGERYVIATIGDSFRATYLLSYDHPMIGRQAGSFLVDPDTYKIEIAPARTFCTAEEVRAIIDSGLGKGGDATNVIVVEKEGYSVPLRYGDELVRHKILDLIGDLALVGRRVHGHVIGIKAGHALNVALAAKIRELCGSLREGG